MCAAGIVGSNDFEQLTLVFKLFTLFLIIGIWLIINSLDLKEKNILYKKKYFIYLFIFWIMFD